MMNSEYKVKKMNTPPDIRVTVPGSKSMTNRALLMAALSNGVTHLEGVLFSDDSRYFIAALQALGFTTEVDELSKKVSVTGLGGQIPNKNGEIYVGSAGTAARFLTAMLGLSDGEYTIQASQQMKARPMEPLFKALESMGASFTYLETEYCLPVRVQGADSAVHEVELDISKSTQFLSALLMTAPMVREGLHIHITSEKSDGAYIRITRKMMKDFGCVAEYDGQDYTVAGGQSYAAGIYEIEPDMSAACYFYALAAVTGGKALVNNVHFDTTQGDVKFLDVLEKMGCKITDMPEGIEVRGPKDGRLSAVSVDMNDFSDQALTLSAIASFADGPVEIRNIAHIRGQECDRLHAMAVNLHSMGIGYEEKEDGIRIYPGIPKGTRIETFEDHRVAMSFALTGMRTDGIVIDNPMCCRKTFENYFEILEEISK